MRTNEEQAIERFKAEGWTPIRGGWPDYLLVRSREGKLELKGVEVKCKGGRVSKAQRLMHTLLIGAGIKVEIVRNAPTKSSK
jgi:hypothetical protein